MEPMDDECNFNPDDMTFAPGYCSTKNFSEAARLASTPYNLAGDMAPLPEPPVSTIKVRHHNQCLLVFYILITITTG